jgi:hypothetical protein
MKRPSSLPPEARRDIDVRERVARNDMAFGLTSIVRALRRGAKREYVELSQSWGGGVIQIAGPVIDDWDLGVLLVLETLALRNPQNKQLGKQVHNLLPQPKEGRLTEDNTASEHETITIRTSLADICNELEVGDDGPTRAAIRKSIRRLTSIVVEAEHGDRWALTHLIQGVVGKGRNSVEVTLSYRLTRAILGSGSYARIYLRSYRALPAGAPRVLYAWLCAWFAASYGERTILLGTLARHVYGEEGVDWKARDHRRAVRKALRVLPSGEFRAREGEGGLVTIERFRPSEAVFGPTLALGEPEASEEVLDDCGGANPCLVPRHPVFGPTPHSTGTLEISASADNTPERISPLH